MIIYLGRLEDLLVSVVRSIFFVVKGFWVRMVSFVFFYEEYMENLIKYEDFDLVLDGVGKY